MANLQLTAAGVLGLNVAGAAASGITKQSVWLKATILLTLAIGLIGLVMGLVAKWHRR